MKRQNPSEGTRPEDWRALEILDPVTIVDVKGLRYEAWIEDKTKDSHILWIRRADLGSRHLLERHDGVRVLPRSVGDITAPPRRRTDHGR